MIEDLDLFFQNPDWFVSHEFPLSYRVIKSDDGKAKIQFKMNECIVKGIYGPLRGVFQLDLDGRPHGEKPHDRDFALDYYVEELEKYKKEHDSEEGFTLDKKACGELFEESGELYNRYVFLHQLNDLQRIVRDTERNMDLFRFVHEYAADEDDRNQLEKWWPYILRINGTTKAKIYISKKNYDLALATIQETTGKIENLEEVNAIEFYKEKERSLKYLQDMEGDIIKINPKSRFKKLHDKLEEAVANEDYEKAAILRDHIAEYLEHLKNK